MLVPAVFGTCTNPNRCVSLMTIQSRQLVPVRLHEVGHWTDRRTGVLG